MISAVALLTLAACTGNQRDQGAIPTTPLTVTPPAVPASALPRSPVGSIVSPASPSATARPPATTPPPSPATTAPSAAATARPALSPTPSATPPQAPDPPAGEPRGFPLDPERHTGLVAGTDAERRILWDSGPAVAVFSREDQPADDPERANRGGWNCRTHQEYEARPAVDWYIPVGTPVRATLDGTATLYVITVTNAFDHYGVDRRPYLGNPDRTHAPLSPFPGPGGGKGVFVQIVGAGHVTEYAHLEIGATVARLPASAFLPGFGPATDYAARFAPLRDFQATTPVARWPVRRGEVIGFTGDSGYSEAPHLHYTVSRAGGPLLCPTREAGFADGGWLFR